MNRPSREQLEQLEQDCKRAAREACRLDAEGKLEEAMTMYAMAACFLEDAIRYCESYEKQRHYAQAAEMYSERGRALEVVLRAQQQQKDTAKPKHVPPQPPGSASANPPPYSSNGQGAAHATSPARVAASPGRAASVGRRVGPGPSGEPSNSADIFQTSSTSMDRIDAKALDPHFLSLPAGGNKMVRAVLEVDTDEGKFVGEARVRMAALQRFLSMRTDTSANHVERDNTTSPRGARAINQTGDDRAARGSTDRGRGGAGGGGGGGGSGGGSGGDGENDDDDGSGGGNNGSGHETSGQSASLPRQSDPSRPSSLGGHGAQGPLANDDGTIRGAQVSYLQEAPRGFDSGVAFRDKNWNELVRRPDAKIGPPQVALDEKVSLSEQTSQRKAQAQAPNARINAKTSDGRIYSIDGGLETAAYIDPNRNLQEVIVRDAKPRPAPSDVRDVVGSPDVLFETAAVGPKLRNQHRIGGERVKEMDHFVASVETPVVRVKQKDVAPLVAEVEMRGAERVMIKAVSDTQHYGGEVGDVELKIQSRYRAEDGSVSEPILRHAAKFHPFIHTVCRDVLGYDGEIQLYYMTTLRADAAVCSISAEDGRLWFNVMAFQQSQPLDPNTGAIKHTKRLWTYWVQRAASALSAGSPEWAAKPTGLYDAGVRQRFADQLLRMGV